MPVLGICRGLQLMVYRAGVDNIPYPDTSQRAMVSRVDIAAK